MEKQEFEKYSKREIIAMLIISNAERDAYKFYKQQTDKSKSLPEDLNAPGSDIKDDKNKE
jgi:hypothetical protein